MIFLLTNLYIQTDPNTLEVVVRSGIHYFCLVCVKY